jgi:tetratricopeptide (TPR) repeat protein
VENDHPLELSTIWDEARTNIEQGNYDKAIETYKYILIMYPDEKVAVEFANAYLGDVYLTLHQPDLAESYIKKAIKLNPKKPAFRYQLGVCYSGKELWKKAVHEFQIALRGEPNNGEYLRGLGWAIFNGGDKVHGLDYLLQANKFEPNNVNIINDVSVAYMGVFDIRNALKFIKKALQIDPGNSLSNDIYNKIKELQRRWPKGDLS